MDKKMKTPLQLEMEASRAFILERVKSVVVGPVGGSDEILSCSPNDLYLSGILFPKQDSMGLAEDDSAGGAEDSAEADAIAPPRNSFKPSSIGMTFSVRNGMSFTIKTGSTSRYSRLPVQPGGQRWGRRQLDLSHHLTAGMPAEPVSFADHGLRLHILARVDGEHTTYTLSLINEAKVGEPGEYASALVFQAQLLVESEGRVFSSRQNVISGSSGDSAVNEMLYRRIREFVVGHGVAAMWDDPVDGLCSRLWTEWMPVQRVESTSADGHASLADFTRRHPMAFSAEWLAGSPRGEVEAALSEFLNCYERWIADIESNFTARAPGHEGCATHQIGECRRALDRMRAGLVTLGDASAWDAFKAANLAMDRQSRYASRGGAARPMVWRPFQLAFLLLSIDSIVRPEAPSRQEMDLLWFPTGGGKTEAYLLLAAFTIFHKRLTSEVRRDKGGVDVLMRYTLRLLTVQQYQRATAVMVACNDIRAEDPEKWGAAPITAGLLVGSDTTPNTIAAADVALRTPRSNSTPAVLQVCPCCGSAFSASSYDLDAELKMLFARCGNRNCAVSRTDGIPSLTIDEVIYAHPPSLLLGTVDKFAQLPRSSNMGALVRNGGVPPDLIIQDELHLISGPLGSISGLYEVLIDELCSCGDVKPKVVGSSATIGGAARQVRALFDRGVMQFPPSGIDSDDSFFAVADPEAPDRLYVGLCNAGRSPKFALQFVQAAIMQAAYLAKTKDVTSIAALDPYWTTVIYYNTIRELGAGLTLSMDDVPMTMRTFARLMDPAHIETRRIMTLPLELSSNVKSSEIPVRIRQLGKPLGAGGFDQPVDTVLASNIISVGLDIPRLGVMIMNQQPKSVSEYIQATSRVGRGIPGLIFTLHNVLRPRDSSQYEHFKYLHSTLYKGVEANSVTPWASRARDKCLAPVYVAMVRHLAAGMSGDADAINYGGLSDDEKRRFFELIAARARSSGRHSGDIMKSVEQLRAELANFSSKWDTSARLAAEGGYKLVYWRNSPNTKSAVLRNAEDAVVQFGETPAPNSMRDVEPSTAYYRNQI